MSDVEIIPILKDNYCYVLRSGGNLAIIDPGEAAPVIAWLDERGLKPQSIWHTHHHGDHTAGTAELLAHYGDVPVYDTANPPPSKWGGERVDILATPGHTLDHICFYLPESGILFSGDTLFSMGCGRVFEGTMEQMWHSLEKIYVLPDDTKLYCGHEYTLSNAEFCLRIEPENKALRQRMEDVKSLRAQGKPTIPVSLKREKETNAFLRAGSPARFAEIRTLKDKG